MSTLYEVTDRLIGEHLDALRAVGWQIDDLLGTVTCEPGDERTMPFVRLISAARLLYVQHAIDAKGRCGFCARRSRVHRTPTRPCTVHAALSYWLLQPDELVLRESPGWQPCLTSIKPAEHPHGDDLMSKRLRPTRPVCRVMTRGVDGVATFAVYGPHRHLVWLSVHTLTPTVVRLWPRVVRFLRDTLDDLADPTNATIMWRLPRTDEHPEYVLLRVPGGDPWLYVYAASPNAIRLTEDRQAFLRQALADLPTMAAECVEGVAERVAGRWRKALNELAAR